MSLSVLNFPHLTDCGCCSGAGPSRGRPCSGGGGGGGTMN